MTLVERATVFFRRRRNARRVGIDFSRSRLFRLPPAIRVNGQKINLDVPDEPGQLTAFVELLLDDCYRLREIAGKVDIATVLDIGANIGLFGLAARAAFPSARIHAYEPNAGLAHNLSAHARQANFQYFIEAVGREADRVALIVDRQ